MIALGKLITAMVTPFDNNGNVSCDQAEKLAHSLLNSGSDGVVVAGTTGESPTLTREEQYSLFYTIKQSIKNDGSVIAGTGSNSTGKAIEYTQDAEKAGVDAALLVVPYYNKPTQEGLYLHFKAIADSTTLPCILYNVPSRTITSLSAETTIRLSQIPNIIGIKDASSDFDQISTVISETNVDFKVWSGNDSDTFGMMCLGGDGVISVASHLIGLQIKNMINLLEQGNLKEAAKEHQRLLPMFKGLFTIANPIPVKYCLEETGFMVGKPRLPLNEVDTYTANFLKGLMSKYKIDLFIEK